MDKKVVVTGCSGFIGYHLSNTLLDDDKTVIGIDSLNNAYDVKLKQKRLEELEKKENFVFLNKNINYDLKIACFNSKYAIGNEYMLPAGPLRENLNEVKNYEISTIYHMAARAGVRQSFLDPQSYIEDNTFATANISNFSKQISCTG